MEARIAIAFVCLFGLVEDVSAREPIKLQLPAALMRLEIQDGKLMVARDGGRVVPVSNDLKDITNFAVADWNDGDGLALAVEAKGFRKSRCYTWMTIWVGDEKALPLNPGADNPGFRIIAKGSILENVEPLSILGLRSYGDGLAVTLCDPANIPDSERKFALRFYHDCAISSKPGMGYSHRLYLTPTAVETIAKEMGQHVWQTEPSPGPNSTVKPSLRSESSQPDNRRE